MTEAELGWVAGVFEGEGNVGIHTHQCLRGGILRRQAQVQVSITNTDVRMVLRVAEITGLGRVRPKKPHGNNRRPQWRWHAAAAQARAFLLMVMPYLVTKREQAEKALDQSFAQLSQRGKGALSTSQWRDYLRRKAELRALVAWRPGQNEVAIAVEDREPSLPL